MAGAIFRVDQSPGAGAGEDGVPRDDLHADQDIQLVPVSPLGNTSYEWSIEDATTGVLCALSAPSSQLTTLTAFGGAGTARVQLKTNGGGPGNVSVQVLRVLSNAPGLATPRRGWGLPAFKESAAENRIKVADIPNTRSYAPLFETALKDIEENAFIAQDTLPFVFSSPLDAMPVALDFAIPRVAHVMFDTVAFRHATSNIQVRLEVLLWHPTTENRTRVELRQAGPPSVSIGEYSTVSGDGLKLVSVDYTDFLVDRFLAGAHRYELRVAPSFISTDPGDLLTNPSAYAVHVLYARLLFRNKV